ncbi:MAG: PQQ-dependent sugar dehydrogenase [Pseudomonadota bacterium]
MKNKRLITSSIAALLGAGLTLGVAPASAKNETVVSRAVDLTTDVTVTPVVDGLEHPWGMAWLPNGDILVTERPGRLRLIRDGKLLAGSIGGTPDVFVRGQGGLLDVAVHPNFVDNNFVYLTYAHGTSDANRTRVARAVLDGMALKDLEVIFEVAEQKPGPQHFGSRLLWLPDGTLLVSIGDGGNPPVAIDGKLIRLRAQDRSSYIGKIVRINDDGSIPQDNPFVASDGAAPAVWSLGHRNVQGMAFNPVRQEVWINEHGALRGDELNRVEPGGNYGWPAVTHSRDYRGATEISPHTSLPDMNDPALVWMETQAPSGLAAYDGARFPDWRGDLFSGGLVSQQVRHIKLDDTGNVREERSIVIGARVRDVKQGPDEYLYVLTDEGNGRLLRLEPAG